MNILHPERFEILVLDHAAKQAFAETLGVSVGGYGSIIHVREDVGSAVVSLLEGVLSAFGSLLVTASAASIPADDSTSTTISCSTPDAALDWLLVDAETGDVLGSGSENAVAGVVSLSFKTGVAGVYDVWLLRKTGNFATGKVRVTVTEV